MQHFWGDLLLYPFCQNEDICGFPVNIALPVVRASDDTARWCLCPKEDMPK